VLQVNARQHQQALFEKVRSCRRRTPLVDWCTASLARVLTTPDEDDYLEFHAMLMAVRANIRRTGLKILDAFHAMDVDRDGLVGWGEL
jgi:hypothetical protein